MNNSSKFLESTRGFFFRARIGFALVLVLTLIYAAITNTLSYVVAILPFGIMLVPGYIEWPFKVKPPQHPGFRMLLISFPVSLLVGFLGTYSSSGMQEALAFGLKMIAFQAFSLFVMFAFLKRAGFKI